MQLKRNRILYSVLIVAEIVTGIAMVLFAAWLPKWFGDSGGDYLWGGMVYLIFAFLLYKAKPAWLLLFSTLFCTGIECSQLYSAPWIDALRSNFFAWLVLGSRFDWNDLLWYGLGAITVFLIEAFVFRHVLFVSGRPKKLHKKYDSANSKKVHSGG